MKEITITAYEADQRLDKFLGKYLREASRSFLYKMLRKKNITLNGKKAEGSEILKIGDSVKLFFSDETFYKFRGEEQSASDLDLDAVPSVLLDVIYEDADIMFINKPAGMLSQKAKADDVSLCEHVTKYLLNKGELDAEALRAFTPSVANRLDRNTSGLITAGKTLKGLQMLSKAFKERSVDKYYLAIVKGKLSDFTSFDGYLNKDIKSNTVSLSKNPAFGEHVHTDIGPVRFTDDYSLVRVKLITGKTHQIRATLFKLGYPIVGDVKYGDPSGYKARRQMLHSHELTFNGTSYFAPLPRDFETVLEKLGLK